MWIFSAIANAVGRNFIGRPNYLFDLLFNRVKADGGVTEAQQCTIEELTDLQNDNLLSSASLVLTPSSYKEGKLYSVIPENGDGDFTFTRATTATRVNSDGLVELVPYNLASYSEEFNNAVYSLTLATITANATTAPNGTLTADKLVEDTTNNIHRVGQGSMSVVSGQIYTFSFYAKEGDRNELELQRINTSGTVFNSISTTTANLTLGTLTVGSNVTASSIESVGNGWYRISVSLTAIATGSGGLNIGLMKNGNVSYLGDGTSGAFIWGFQVNEGTNALPYQKTETRLNIPRLDYSLGGCPNILLEPQRTNLALQSSSFDSASWAKDNSSVTANSTTSPSGITDADTLTADGTSNRHEVTQIISFTSGLTYTFSVYIKKNTNNFVQILFSGAIFSVNSWANFDLNSGVLGSVGSAATASIESVGNGWYRCTIVATATGTALDRVYLVMTTSPTSIRRESNTLSTSVYLWGAQLELGSYSTSFIPTTTASVTRNADSITRNNIFTNGLITAAGGTWFVELRNNRVLTRDTADGIYIGDSSTINTGNQLMIRKTAIPTNGRLSIVKYVSGSATAIFETTTDTAKVAIKWNGTTADVFVNGVKVVSATAFTTTNMEFLNCFAADVPKYINQMALFPTPLTDEQCSILTSDSYPTAAAAYASLGLVSESPSCLTSTTTF